MIKNFNDFLLNQNNRKVRFLFKACIDENPKRNELLDISNKDDQTLGKLL